MTASTPPLRGTDHPYYAAEGSYFAVGWHTEFGSWAEFIEEQGSNDLDYNLLYRWDWRIPDPDDYEPGEELPGESVSLYFVHQRKGITRSACAQVRPEDEPAIREWLLVRAEHMRSLWEPLLPGPAS